MMPYLFVLGLILITITLTFMTIIPGNRATRVGFIGTLVLIATGVYLMLVSAVSMMLAQMQLSL